MSVPLLYFVPVQPSILSVPLLYSVPVQPTTLSEPLLYTVQCTVYITVYSGYTVGSFYKKGNIMLTFYSSICQLFKVGLEHKLLVYYFIMAK